MRIVGVWVTDRIALFAGLAAIGVLAIIPTKVFAWKRVVIRKLPPDIVILSRLAVRVCFVWTFNV